MIELIEKALLFDDHQSSSKDKAISTTTLIGPNWKAQRDMLKDGVNKTNTDPMMRRSSFLGSAAHSRFELSHKNTKDILQEQYAEKEIDGVWISGKFDFMYKGHLGDLKTGYGKKFSDDKIDKAILQMSIYRWLNQDLKPEDEAYVLFVSQSNNAYESIPITLMSIKDTEQYIRTRIQEVKAQETIDCLKKPYNACDYCNYDESKCKEMLGGF